MPTFKELHTYYRGLTALVPLVLAVLVACASATIAGEGARTGWSWQVPMVLFRAPPEPTGYMGLHSSDEIAAARVAAAMQPTCFASTPLVPIAAARAFLEPAADERTRASLGPVAFDVLAPSEQFDARHFSQAVGHSFFTSPTIEPAEDFGHPAGFAFFHAQYTARADCFEPIGAGGWANIGQHNGPSAFAPPRRRPLAPAGTMFIWSVAAAAADADGAPAAGARQRQSSSAGLVLTRPPGIYSIDWVGVAFTASLH